VRYLGQANYDFGIFPPPTGLPASLFVVGISAVGMWFFLNRTSMGRHIFAIGGNPHAARVSGINVDRVLVYVYAISGFFAGLGGLLLAGRTDSGFPLAGQNAELDAIAAVIIGGASFFGDHGTDAQRPQPEQCQPFLAADPDRTGHHRRRLHRRSAPPCGGETVVENCARRRLRAGCNPQSETF
jgi:hypothetical protein